MAEIMRLSMHEMIYLGPGGAHIFTHLPYPGVSKIGFSPHRSQDTIAKLLVLGWVVQRSTSECNNPPDGPFKVWKEEVDPLTPEECEQLPRNPDTKTLHTPWRDQIYYMWNHVFYDVGNWLSAMYRARSFEPPNIELFAIDFPTSHENGNSGKVPAATKVWDSNTLLAPAYLAPGVSLRVETLQPGEEDKEPSHPADFDHKDRYCVWFVREGLQMRFYVEGDWDQRTDGVAAVMVYGKMLGEPVKVLDQESEESEESEGDENDGDGEDGEQKE
ncbi:hypothetical protein PENARI_c023G02705 [Penicillium arizonense]|uniref:Uncharacterized protein n=1 Tax=Penicillium arizonense TaxID=1835702 RepID=A0A1F5L829_PENAI|nr:hypothetical protein PENARI_c023G02705 [Penicillium arizonense]OGE49071.1 hypothetical protein PENARI_c023G02705 [Penicillium arizonense]